MNAKRGLPPTKKKLSKEEEIEDRLWTLENKVESLEEWANSIAKWKKYIHVR